MYTLLRSVTLKQLALEQAPSALFALVVAELFYKFHSFTLECGAFLVTWYAADYVAHYVRRPRSRAGGPAGDGPRRGGG